MLLSFLLSSMIIFQNKVISISIISKINLTENFLPSTDNQFWEDLVDMTKLRAAQVAEEKPGSYYIKYMRNILTTHEMRAFIGVRLLMENAIIKRRYTEYWRSDGKNFVHETPGFHDIFERDRFLAIWTHLHVVNEQDPAVDKQDRIYKVRPLLNDMLTKFKNFYMPGEFLSLDEGMIPTKNRLSIKQNIKDKPIKWGIKSFLLTDSETGYIVNADIYTGFEDLQHPELGITGNVVTRLLTGAGCDNRGHVLVMDRFYNSVSLFHHLFHKEKTFAVGTAMTNRKFFQKDIMCKKPATRGDSDYLSRENISCMVWNDRKPIYFLSNFHDPTNLGSCNRRQKNGTLIDVPAPTAVLDYNRFKCGCYLNDQQTQLYKPRRHYKWPRRLIIKILMWAIYNAYVLHRESTVTKMNFTQFLDDVCYGLIGAFRSSHIRRSRRSNPNTEKRFLDVGIHMPEVPADTSCSHSCKVCYDKHMFFKKQYPNAKYGDIPTPISKSTIRCSECKVYLCLRRGTTCWKQYHSVREYWRD